MIKTNTEIEEIEPISLPPSTETDSDTRQNGASTIVSNKVEKCIDYGNRGK